MLRAAARMALSLLLALCLAAAASIWILQSHWFGDLVRRRVVLLIETASGGRAELGAFYFNWRTLTASVAPFVLHGAEPPGEAPLLQAKRIEIGFRIVSLLRRRVDLASLRIEEPRVAVIVDSSGRSNIPRPGLSPPGTSLIQAVLDVRIGKVSLEDGWLRYNTQRLPLRAEASNLRALAHYDPAGPAYDATLSADAIKLNAPGRVADALVRAQAKVRLDRSRLHIDKLGLFLGGSQAEFSGDLNGLSSPQGELAMSATIRPHDIAVPFRVPIENRGQIGVTGKLSFAFDPVLTWTLRGATNARGLEYRLGAVDFRDAALQSSFELSQNRLELRPFQLTVAGGQVRGAFLIEDWDAFSVAGTADNFPISEVAAAVAAPATQLSGTAGGTFAVRGGVTRLGFHDVMITSELNVEAGSAGVPIEGRLQVSWDQNTREIDLGDSRIDAGVSHIEASGVLGKSLAIHARSQNLREVDEVLSQLNLPFLSKLPLTLDRGGARFDGTVSGALDNPQISGQLEIGRFTFSGESLDRLSARFELTRSLLRAESFIVSRGATRLEGSGQAGLSEWNSSGASPIRATLVLTGAQIGEALDRIHSKVPVSGAISGRATIQGTWDRPEGTADVEADRVLAWQESVDRVTAHLSLAGARLDVTQASLTGPAGSVNLKGSYSRDSSTRDSSDWSSGSAAFEIQAASLDLARIGRLHRKYEHLGGQAEVNVSGEARIAGETARVESLNGQLSVRGVVFEGRPYGSATLTAQSRDGILELRAQAAMFRTQITGKGEWSLSGDSPGHGELIVPRISVAAMHDLVPNPSRLQLPFDGFAEGRIRVDGPLRKPEQLRAELRVTALQLTPGSSLTPRAGAQVGDLVIRNDGPLVLEATREKVDIKQARLIATSTSIEAKGSLAWNSESPWNVSLKGSINLAILQIFNPDLLGSGVSVLAASVRGPLLDPEVEGRMELRDASLYVTDLPNGLDQANGLIVFDKNRASVDSLSAVTGGGRVTLQKGSFVGFRGPVLIYRVQATADSVRYRSPEGVSLTANGSLSLVGTSESSLLSGTITVVRAGFNPTTDVGNILAQAARPVAAPAVPNEYLRGLQFDVRIVGSRSLEIETYLTRNIEAEMNLRVRGAPDRPVVLGNITVNEGQIEFFGNRYHINRGEVSFYNPAKIDPIIDMDLETTVRGITVDISFTGPLNKLNFSYRSDPPLHSNEIIALLAVGRTPLSTNSLSSQAASTSGTNYLSTSSSDDLLSQAIAAPAAGRLQRFFGVSHIKIDPQLSDITAVPQARLTVEQQVSRDVTVTYITNLTRTQEQILRLEWTLTRQVSLVALRDENGEFSIDFQYRKRFK